MRSTSKISDWFVRMDLKNVLRLCARDSYLFLHLMKSIILHFPRYLKGITTNYMATSKNRDGLTSISKVRQPFLIKKSAPMAQRESSRYAWQNTFDTKFIILKTHIMRGLMIRSSGGLLKTCELLLLLKPKLRKPLKYFHKDENSNPNRDCLSEN